LLTLAFSAFGELNTLALNRNINILEHDIWPCKDSSSPFFRKVAYFSMEVAIDQSLKTYSGGLGYLAGSHMRSAYDLKQNTFGISILWRHGYYTQNLATNRDMRVDYIEHYYSFLHQTGISFPVNVHGHNIIVRVLLLLPETFGTAPIFFLSTGTHHNDLLSKSATHRLYDSNTATRIAQSIILGVGGAKLVEILGAHVDVYHMNEGHALPLAFYLYSKCHNLEQVRKHLVFTTHTPEKAGNDEVDLGLLKEMGFFSQLPLDEVKQIAHIEGNSLNYTLTALRMSRKANGVSELHGKVANEMWKDREEICPIISITNAQNKKYWVDKPLEDAFQKNDDEALVHRKKELKKKLFKVVADQAGKLFSPDVLTIVWARRFAGYKRPAFLLHDLEHFLHLVTRRENPVQVIWAGKPYPEDQDGVNTFNYIQSKTDELPHCAVLVGYELGLSALLKKGADVWLNTPRITREASGTSGMTASMNGAINFSVPDGWVPEFARHGENGFYLPPLDPTWSLDKQDYEDYKNMTSILDNEVVPTYYNQPEKWVEMMKTAMREVSPKFDSDRMVREYYEKLYAE
jgi:glycogen phosphorylase